MDRPMPIPILIGLLLLLAAGATGFLVPMTGTPGPGGGTAVPPEPPPVSPVGSTVSPGAPFPDPEPHEISPRFVKNIAEYGEGGRPLVTIHDATYTLRYQSKALAADVVKAPFLVTFTVTPGQHQSQLLLFHHPDPGRRQRDRCGAGRIQPGLLQRDDEEAGVHHAGEVPPHPARGHGGRPAQAPGRGMTQDPQASFPAGVPPRIRQRHSARVSKSCIFRQTGSRSSSLLS